MTVRVGLVGSGRIGRVHAEAYRSVVGGELAACTDVIAATAEAFARDHGVETVASFEAMLAREDIDAVLIATPNGLHPSQTIAALRAGKHVFCQKPIALTLAEADQVVRAAEGAAPLLQFGFMLRFTPPFPQVHQRIARGELGAPIASRAAVFGWEPSADWFYRKDSGGGVVLDTLVHFADLLLWCLGPVTRVYADGGAYVLEGSKRHASPDNATIQLRHASGATTSLYATWTAGHGNLTFEVYGTDASLSVDLVEKQVVRMHRRRPLNGDAAGFGFPDLVWSYGYAGEQQYFVDRIRGAVDGTLATTPAEARAALALVLAMQESLDSEAVVALA